MTLAKEAGVEPTTLQALRVFPEQLCAFYDAIAPDHANWAPQSWNGIPSESFTPIEQICHVRDIETDGYQVRLRRALAEPNPSLADIDGYRLARERNYAHADAAQALAAFRQARADTVALISDLSGAELERPATFGDYGIVSVRSLVHLLCSHDQQHLAGLQWLLGRIEASRHSDRRNPA